MGNRTALLIRCSVDEAATIRGRAKRDRRTVSAYILTRLTTALRMEEMLFARLSRFQEFNRMASRTAVRPPGPRTAILLRCSVHEAKRIRAAAERRRITISGFVLHALRRSWKVAEEIRETRD
jgi:uncharacterized protein (DUF1778 family)